MTVPPVPPVSTEPIVPTSRDDYFDQTAAGAASRVAPLTVVLTGLVVVVALVASGVLLLSQRPPIATISIYPPQPTATVAPSATPASIAVYVSGAVNQPDTLVDVPFGSRVSRAIEAAGGFAADADRATVNLAALVADGDQIFVARQAESGSTQADSQAVVLPTSSGGNRVYINNATVDEIATLPGIGPALAQSIVQYREENGPFLTLNDLDAVNGIGPSKLNAIAELVAFD